LTAPAIVIEANAISANAIRADAERRPICLFIAVTPLVLQGPVTVVFAADDGDGVLGELPRASIAVRDGKSFGGSNDVCGRRNDEMQVPIRDRHRNAGFDFRTVRYAGRLRGNAPYGRRHLLVVRLSAARH
jgi:hypothetical protein